MSGPYLKPAGFALLGLLLIASVAWLKRDQSLEALRRNGEIRIGYAVEPPFAFVGSGKMVTGESPEIAKRIATRLGLSGIRWKQMEFGSLLNRLAAGKIDVVAAGVFITPERARIVSFSRPTAVAEQALLVAVGNPLELHSYDDLRLAGASVAVLGGSFEQVLLEKIGVPHESTVRVPDARSGREAVESHSVDAFAISAPTLRWWEAQGRLRSSEIARPFAPPQRFPGTAGFTAFAFRPEDAQLRRAWDRELENFLGTEAHRRLAASFGIDADALPEGMTAGDVIDLQ